MTIFKIERALISYHNNFLTTKIMTDINTLSNILTENLSLKQVKSSMFCINDASTDTIAEQ